jgi:hypothetical protein
VVAPPYHPEDRITWTHIADLEIEVAHLLSHYRSVTAFDVDHLHQGFESMICEEEIAIEQDRQEEKSFQEMISFGESQ